MKQTVNAVHIYYKITSVTQTAITRYSKTDRLGSLWVNTRGHQPRTPWKDPGKEFLILGPSASLRLTDFNFFKNRGQHIVSTMLHVQKTL